MCVTGQAAQTISAREPISTPLTPVRQLDRSRGEGGIRAATAPLRVPAQILSAKSRIHRRAHRAENFNSTAPRTRAAQRRAAARVAAISARAAPTPRARGARAADSGGGPAGRVLRGRRGAPWTRRRSRSRVLLWAAHMNLLLSHRDR